MSCTAGTISSESSAFSSSLASIFSVIVPQAPCHEELARSAHDRHDDHLASRRGGKRPGVKEAYTFWVLFRMRESMPSHDLYVTPIERYGDLRSQLLQGAAWEAVRPQALRRLNWAADAESALSPLREALDTAYQTTAAHWETNPAVRLEAFAGKGRLVWSPLDRMEDPASLRRLRNRVASLLPLRIYSWRCINGPGAPTRSPEANGPRIWRSVCVPFYWRRRAISVSIPWCMRDPGAKI